MSSTKAALRCVLFYSQTTAYAASRRSGLHPQSFFHFHTFSCEFLGFFSRPGSLLPGSGTCRYTVEKHGVSSISDSVKTVCEMEAVDRPFVREGMPSDLGILPSCNSFLRPLIFGGKQLRNSIEDRFCDSLLFLSVPKMVGCTPVGIRSFSSGPSLIPGILSAQLETKPPPNRSMLGAFLLPSPTPLAPPSAPNKYDKGADNLGFLRGLQGKQKQMIKKFVNICMDDGKKTKARALVYETFQHLAVRGDVVTILDKAVENVRPICEVKRVRIAGVTHNVPSTIAKHRQETLALRWLLEAAVKRRSSKKSLSVGQCLCDEILDASQKTGMARKKRDDLHKLAEVNRTFAHYRWW